MVEVVIKIKESDLERIKDILVIDKKYSLLPETTNGIAYKAIANGTVLPKGHGRLIDANDVDNHIIGSVDLRDCPTIVEADKG